MAHTRDHGTLLLSWPEVLLSCLGGLGRVGLQVTKAGRSKWEELKFNSKHVASRGDLTNFGDLNAKLVSIFQVALGNGKLERKQS